MDLARTLIINEIGYIFYRSVRIIGSYMLKLNYFLVLIVFCLTTTLYSQEEDSSSTVEQKSGLSFNLMKYDFGVVESGVEVNYVFKFENIASDTVKIDKVGST